LHTFLKEQPDVNWRNPQLQNAMEDVIRFWLNLGVDGFRLDVVNWFVKDQQFRNNPYRRWGLRPYDWQQHLYDRNRPETLEIMKQIRTVVDEYPDRMTVGEVYTEPPGDPELVARYYGQGEGLHMAFNFAFLFCPWRAAAFAQAVERWEALLGPDLWPNYTLSNHDQPRAFSRYARGQDSLARARLAAAMLLTLRGTPFVYYGEEIGMRNSRIPHGRLQDPVGKRYWPFHPGRDGERTPMQWDNSLNSGFSQTEPWLPVHKDYQTVNVAAQQQAPGSLLNWYRALIQLRQSEPALHSGRYRCRGMQDDIFCFQRQLDNDIIVVALNFAAQERAVSLPPDYTWQTLLSSQFPKDQRLETNNVRLQRYGVLIAKAHLS
jgi:alpha-glucosidase